MITGQLSQPGSTPERLAAVAQPGSAARADTTARSTSAGEAKA
jgi:hypothetical protein